LLLLTNYEQIFLQQSVRHDSLLTWHLLFQREHALFDCSNVGKKLISVKKTVIKFFNRKFF